MKSRIVMRADFLISHFKGHMAVISINPFYRNSEKADNALISHFKAHFAHNGEIFTLV